MQQMQLEHLIRVARGLAPASAWIRGGKVFNVFTGEVAEADVVIAHDRIAAVGGRDALVDERTHIIDATGLTLVPGYFEPHAHSCLIYNPQTFAQYAVARGTTAVLQDNLPFFLHLSQAEMEQVFQALDTLPLKSYWWCRLDPQLGDEEQLALFTPERIEQTLAHQSVLQAGELTAWRPVFDLDPDMVARVAAARTAGKRMEAHNPGASMHTLTVMAAAGMTACHESISGEDVWTRVRLGYHAALRNSSIRPDLREIIRGLLDSGFTAWDRLMFTTDGSSPFFLADGTIDACIAIALSAGLPAATAYKMASHNVAAYYGLDAHLGSIAPGRAADILFLESLQQPTPLRVMTDGRLIAQAGQFTGDSDVIDWGRLGVGHLPMLKPSAVPAWFNILPTDITGRVGATETVPVIEFSNAVITRIQDTELPVAKGDVVLDGAPDCLYAAVIDRLGSWVSTGVVKGLGRFDAVATSHLMTGDLLAVGRDKTAMAKALNRVVAMGGGICLHHGGEVVFELQLPMFNTMSTAPMGDLIDATRTFDDHMRSFGYRFEDPIYSLLFLSATHLPAGRLTRLGLLEVKTGRVLRPSRALPV